MRRGGMIEEFENIMGAQVKDAGGHGFQGYIFRVSNI